MYIEDLLLLLSNKAKTNPYDQKLITSFCDQIFVGNGLTEKQANLAIKILSRQSSKLDLLLGKSVQPFLDNPTFKLARRVTNHQKRVSVVSHADFGKAIKVEFPWNEGLLEKIRRERVNLHYANWDKEQKAWFFPLSEKSIQLVLDISSSQDFCFDEEFADYALQVEQIKINLENYVPIIKKVGNKFQICNIKNKIPLIDSENVLEALFHARRLGIFTWDDSVLAEIKEKNIDDLTIRFLNVDPSRSFLVNLEENSISSVEDIVKNLLPCVFVIPGGNEFTKTQTSLELLNKIGISNSEISVLFRLPKETGENFNQWVKDCNLNNPLTEKTKAIFISSKIPKPVIESNIRFNSVVNFSMHSAHYSIRDFIKNHHNIIHILDKKPVKENNFAFM